MSQTMDDEKRKRIIRNAIIRSGRTLIKLILLKRSMRRISAVDTVFPVVREDETTGEKTIRFREASQKIEFTEDEELGEFTAEILDTPHNREFLASNYSAKIWKIADPEMDETIKEMSVGVKDKVFKTVTDKEEPKQLKAEKLKEPKQPKAEKIKSEIAEFE